MLDSQCIKFFLGLQEKDHIIREEVGKIFHIVVSSDTTEQFCPKCGCATKYIKGYYNQTVKAGYLSGIPIEVVLRKRRYICKHCGKTFNEHYDFVAKHYHIAKNVFNNIIQCLKSTTSMKSIATANNVSTNTVQRTLNLMPSSKLSHLPEVLSIDEFKGNAGGEKYLVQVSDAKEKKLLAILPSRKKAYLSDYFASFPLEERKKVKYLVIDMWKDYASLRAFFPNIKIVIDRFHYKRQVHWAIDRIRKRVQKTLQKNGRIHFKRLRSLLHKSYDDLKIEERDLLLDMIDQNQELSDAWHLKEMLNDIMKMTDTETAIKRFKEWIKLVESLHISDFNDCTKAYRRWFKGITESFKVPYSNGFTEGKNNKIKVLKRNAYGFTNFDNFSKRILLVA